MRPRPLVTPPLAMNQFAMAMASCGEVGDRLAEGVAVRAQDQPPVRGPLDADVGGGPGQDRARAGVEGEAELAGEARHPGEGCGEGGGEGRRSRRRGRA